MIKRVNKYIRTVIDAMLMLKDFGNHFLLVSQQKYNGKIDDKTGETILKPGVKVTLQVIEDHADPVIDRDTGRQIDDNTLNTFDVTIPGCEYPLPLNKGDQVSLGEFDEKHSYYIDGNLILRFKSIYPWKAEKREQVKV